MPIDWFTVGAQMLNFLILVGLLKRYLYGPVLAAIDAREKRIAAELADAGTKRAEAEKERAGFLAKNGEIDRQRGELLAKARDEAAAERRRLCDEARADSDAIRAKRNEALEHELRTLMDEIALRTRESVFAIARKTLADLAGISLEQRMCEVFASRLGELNGDAGKSMETAVETARGPALVRGAFDFSAEQQELIRQALARRFPSIADVRFETAPELINGIEFIANGQKVSWSVADYLASMEDSVGGLLETNPGNKSTSP